MYPLHVSFRHVAPASIHGMPDPATEAAQTTGGPTGEKADQTDPGPEAQISQEVLHSKER